MRRLVGMLAAATLFFGSSAVALSCSMSAQDHTCCCTAAGGRTQGHCPMLKTAPAPTSAVLPALLDLTPTLVSVALPAPAPSSVSDSRRNVFVHDSQAPPATAAFRTFLALRGPPAPLA